MSILATRPIYAVTEADQDTLDERDLLDNIRDHCRLEVLAPGSRQRVTMGLDDLADSTVMRGLRQELDIGVITAVPGCRKGIEAKRNIAELLDVPVPCLKRL